VDVVKCSFAIPLDDPVVLVSLVDLAVEERDTVHRSATRAKAIRAVEEVAFPDWFQQHLEQVLHDAVFEGQDTEWPQLAVRLGDENASYGKWSKAARAQVFADFLNEGRACLFGRECLFGDAVDAWRTCAFVGQNDVERGTYPLLLTDQPIQVVEPMRRIVLRFDGEAALGFDASGHTS
jgi:hypothetical protein